MKRTIWSSLLLGLWLMISPFVLVVLNHGILKILWEDLLLGFGIAAFSLCRLLARAKGEIVILDWLITALGFLTLVNPFLYSYFNMKFAAWNNLSIGVVVLLLAVFQDWRDSHDDQHLIGPQHHVR
jgi:hypothetical protein